MAYTGKQLDTKLYDVYTKADTDARILTLSPPTPDEITKASNNPTATINAVLGDVWVNTSTAEFFVCTDATTNANRWIGSNGTYINYAVFQTDILGDNSCIAFYKLDGNVVDESGNYNGSSQGSASYGTGKHGTAQTAQGVDSGSVFPWSLVSGTGSRTITLWVKQITPSTTPYFGMDYSGQRGFAVYYTGASGAIGNGDGTPMNLNEWHIFNGGSTNTDNVGRISDSNMPINEWTHLAIVCDTSTSTVTLYRNGSLVGSTAIAGFSTFNTSYNFPMYLGCNNYVDSIPANGSYFDHVRFFNKALNSTEVATVYTEENI